MRTMSGSSDSKCDNTIINIAKQSGLLDSLKSKNQSASVSSTSRPKGNVSIVSSNYASFSRGFNETEACGSVFKVPQAPVSSHQRRGIEWDFKNNTNNLALQISCRNLRKQLNAANKMYVNNELILSTLYSELTERIMEFVVSEHEKTINPNSSIVENGLNTDISTSVNESQCSSHMNRNFSERFSKPNRQTDGQNINNRQIAEREFSTNSNFIEPERPFSRESSVASVPEPNQRPVLIPSNQGNESIISNNHICPNIKNRKEFPSMLDSYIKDACRNNYSQQITTVAETYRENVYSPVLGSRENIFSKGIFSESDFESSPPFIRDNRRENKRTSIDSPPNQTVLKKRSNNNESNIKGIKKLKTRPSLNVSSAKAMSSIIKCQQIKNWMVQRKENSKEFEILGQPISMNGKIGIACNAGTIFARRNRSTVRTSSGIIVLVGPMKVNHNTHPAIKTKFLNGFPVNWRNVLNHPDLAF